MCDILLVKLIVPLVIYSVELQFYIVNTNRSILLNIYCVFRVALLMTGNQRHQVSLHYAVPSNVVFASILSLRLLVIRICADADIKLHFRLSAYEYFKLKSVQNTIKLH